MESLIACTLVFVLTFVNTDCRLVNVTFTRNTGQFIMESPTYPNNAPALSNMIWEFTAPPGKKLSITCNDIRILKRTGCSEGSLTVWDGATQYNMCNVIMHFQRESVRNKLFAQFRSGQFGVGRARCVVRVVEASYMDSMVTGEPDSREHGGANGARGTTCPCGWTNKKRIVGGRETSPNEYPFMVGIQKQNTGERFCGGSLISSRHVLTAAHCTYGVYEPLAAVVGEHDYSTDTETNATKTIRVQQIINHERYNHNDMTNDICLLVLAEPVQFNQLVGPICLPNEKYNLLNTYIKVLGWGLTSNAGQFSDILQKVNLRVIDLKTCAGKYTNPIDTQNPTQICTFTNNKDSCQGDSGGPLIMNDPETNRLVQVALVSYGKECASSDPAVNIDVFKFTNWIETQVNKLTPSVNTCEKLK